MLPRERRVRETAPLIFSDPCTGVNQTALSSCKGREACLRGGVQRAKKVALAPLLSAPSLGPEQDDFMVQGRSSRQMGPGEQCNVSSYRRDMAWPLLGLQVLA